MKKNYMSPVVEVNVFAVEDVVMTSVVDPTPTTPSASKGNTQAINDFKSAASTAGAIVVEW